MSTRCAGNIAAVLLALAMPLAAPFAAADTIPAEMLDRNLQVTTWVGAGLAQPIGIAFIGSNDAFILEKATGRVRRVTNGVLQAEPVLDLAVNSASERGLLGIALHPNFPAVPFVYIRWTESSTGQDTTALGEVPLLGNRVDRFTWDGTRLSLRLADRVADNVDKFGATESETLLIGRGFGITPAIEQGPDGNLYVVSLSDGVVYRISRATPSGTQ